MRRLTIVFHHAGGGHRNAAEALKATLSHQSHPWDVTLLDMQELLDRVDVVRRFTGIRIQEAYNLILRRGWTRFTPQLLKVLQTTIRVYHSRIVRLLRTYWAEHPADLVLSVIPHFNREIAESLKVDGQEKPPFVTLITDLADYPPRFWIEPESEYIIAGTERAKAQAMAMGHPAPRVFETSGMVLKPKFYEKLEVDRVVERQAMGLDPNRMTGIVLFGGHGSSVMTEIVRNLDRSALDVQLILICGHNKRLEAKLKAMETRMQKVVLGFSTTVEHYMALADFFIGKPGPGSISEALQLHLPVIVACNPRTLPQERFNATWVTEKGFGMVVRSFREIGPAVSQLTEISKFNQLRNNINKYSNRALFEVAEILESCAERSTTASAPGVAVPGRSGAQKCTAMPVTNRKSFWPLSKNRV